MAPLEEKDRSPWNDELSDFTLILDTSENIKCHKAFLAKASPVMKSMLTSNMLEARTNQMKLTGYDLETVTSFLEFVYGDYAQSFEITDDRAVERGMHEFNRKGLTVALLRLADQYQVQDLRAFCIANLKRSSDLEILADTWKAAKELDIEELKLSNESIMRYVSEAKGCLVLECHDCDEVTELKEFACRNDSCGHFKMLLNEDTDDCCVESKVSLKFPTQK